MVKPTEGNRISKIDTYLNCAEVFAYRSTCLKRKYGAVIVKEIQGACPVQNCSPAAELAGSALCLLLLVRCC